MLGEKAVCATISSYNLDIFSFIRVQQYLLFWQLRSLTWGISKMEFCHVMKVAAADSSPATGLFTQ